MKYFCKHCGSIFEPPFQGNKYQSLLVTLLRVECIYCKSTDIELTEKSKLLIERKAKINKIEENKKTSE
jgi:hypothetical protein